MTSAGNASATNLTITSFSNSNTYCVHSVNGLLQTTASDCGAGGGGGAGWATSTPNIVYNNYGTLVGINSTTPTANLTVQGKSGSTTPIFVVASSSNAQYLTVLAKGYVGIGSSTPSTQLAVTSLSSTVDPFDVSTSTSGSLFHISANGNVGIGMGIVSTKLLTISDVASPSTYTQANAQGIQVVAASGGGIYMS